MLTNPQPSPLVFPSNNNTPKNTDHVSMRYALLADFIVAICLHVISYYHKKNMKANEEAMDLQEVRERPPSSRVRARAERAKHNVKKTRSD